MIVQIYEIQTPQEAEKCIESGVDHIGSVLLSKDGWRDPRLKEVMALSDGTGVKNNLIPLFHDQDTICRVMDYYCPNYIHFCDTLTDVHGEMEGLEAFCSLQSEIKNKFPEIGIIRSIPIPLKDSIPFFPTLEIARVFEPFSDMFLTDTWLGKEPVEGFIGITGITPDWKMATELVIQSGIPVILAGGLSPENVYKAVMTVLPAGADSCTQTNMMDKDGKPIRFEKDFKKVDEFVSEVRRAEIQRLTWSLDYE